MTRLDHVNITVNNLDESIAWYHELFGFQKVEGGTNERGIKWAIIASNDSMIAMSEWPQMRNADDDGVGLGRGGQHKVYHFGLRIDSDIDWRKKVEEHGLKLHYGGEIHYPHSRSWYVHDPSGHEIEVS